ncbi:MAG: MarR family transcriptional regulator [Methanoregula sp.]|nr:MarR family transcriptional regulator [Methanoregula sp.]
MDTLTRLFNKAATIEREPVDTGDGILLHTSEIHLIDVAGRFPNESMSVLASRLGITKGAVSQTAKKLEEKGYLERINLEGNNKTILIRLTDSGTRAFGWHRAYHAVVNDRIAREVTGLERKDRENIRKILWQIEKIFDDCPDTRRRITQGMYEDKPKTV